MEIKLENTYKGTRILFAESAKRKREILSNFAIKHGITPDQAYQYINQALNDPSKKKEDIIKKLKECY